jgi:predicted 3'-5' exonuclease similar to PolB exonuclease domain
MRYSFRSARGRVRQTLTSNWKNQGDAAVSALTGQVLAAGYAVDDGPVEILHGDHPGDEARILAEFWRLWSTEGWLNSEIIGFNILNFDLKFLQQRSFRHGIKVPADEIFTARDRKWTHKRIIDLMQRFREMFIDAHLEKGVSSSGKKPGA